jgi:hypothetical protein
VTTNVSASDAATAHDGAARKIANRLRRAAELDAVIAAVEEGKPVATS